MLLYDICPLYIRGTRKCVLGEFALFAVDSLIIVTFLAKLINTRNLYSYLFLKHEHSKRLGSRKHDACVDPVVNKTGLDNIRNEKTMHRWKL